MNVRSTRFVCLFMWVSDLRRSGDGWMRSLQQKNGRDNATLRNSRNNTGKNTTWNYSQSQH